MRHGKLYIKIVFIAVILSNILGCAGSSDSSFYKKPDIRIDFSNPTVIISDKIGFNQDMTFADILSTELLNKGVNLMDRSVLQGLLKDKGITWDQIISGQQYFNIGKSSPVKTIIVINADMIGQMLSKASCRVLDSNTGSVLMSMNITNPQPYNSIYLGNKSTSSIAKEWANYIVGQRH